MSYQHWIESLQAVFNQLSYGIMIRLFSNYFSIDCFNLIKDKYLWPSQNRGYKISILYIVNDETFDTGERRGEK